MRLHKVRNISLTSPLRLRYSARTYSRLQWAVPALVTFPTTQAKSRSISSRLSPRDGYIYLRVIVLYRTNEVIDS